MATTNNLPDDEMTESEYERMVDERETVYVTSEKTDRTIHIHECEQLTHPQTSQVTPKSPDAFPYGFFEVCSFCLRDWRNCNVETQSFDREAFTLWLTDQDGPVNSEQLDAQWPDFPHHELRGVTGPLVDGEPCYYRRDLWRVAKGQPILD